VSSRKKQAICNAELLPEDSKLEFTRDIRRKISEDIAGVINGFKSSKKGHRTDEYN
jgi:hypothetical protein